MIAIILSFILIGSGNIYNQLYKRGIVEFGIAIMLSFIFADILRTNTIGFFIMFLIGFVWWAYCLYDTMNCTDAINNNHRIPLFLNRIKLE